jgi:hypothetical protein
VSKEKQNQVKLLELLLLNQLESQELSLHLELSTLGELQVLLKQKEN